MLCARPHTHCDTPVRLRGCAWMIRVSSPASWPTLRYFAFDGPHIGSSLSHPAPYSDRGRTRSPAYLFRDVVLAYLVGLHNALLGSSVYIFLRVFGLFVIA